MRCSLDLIASSSSFNLHVFCLYEMSPSLHTPILKYAFLICPANEVHGLFKRSVIVIFYSHLMTLLSSALRQSFALKKKKVHIPNSIYYLHKFGIQPLCWIDLNVFFQHIRHLLSKDN